MSTLSGWRPESPLHGRPRARAVLSALGICLVAVAAGVIGIVGADG